MTSSAGSSRPRPPDAGDRRPGGQPPLARPPGDRYRTPADEDVPDASATTIPGIAVAVLVGLGGAALIVVLGGVLSLSAGLLVVAGGTGWLIGRVLGTVPTLAARSRRVLAVVLAVDAVVMGQVALWAYSLAQGGALGPLEYLAQTWGPLPVLQGAVAALAAWWASR